MDRLIENKWEHPDLLRVGLQFFAEGAGGDGNGSGGSDGGATSPAGEAGADQTTQTGGGSVQGYYEAMSKDERDAFLKKNGLLHHTAASARYKTATEKAAKLDGLQDSFADLAKVYGLDEGDHEGILRAAMKNPARIHAKARELGVSDEVAEGFLDIQDENNRLKRAKTEQIKTAEQQRMAKEEDETREAYQTFDFSVAAKNPAFKAMVDAGIHMKTAYESAFHAELAAVAIQAAKEEARVAALAEYRANGARPDEGAGGSTGEANMRVDYKSMTKEQLRAAEKKFL